MGDSICLDESNFEEFPPTPGAMTDDAEDCSPVISGDDHAQLEARPESAVVPDPPKDDI